MAAPRYARTADAAAERLTHDRLGTTLRAISLAVGKGLVHTRRAVEPDPRFALDRNARHVGSWWIRLRGEGGQRP